MLQVRVSSPPPIRFGIFELDLRTGELRRSGTKLRLDGQPFQVLALLLERAGELVSREDLKRKLWPTDTFVDFEHGINTAVKRLRETLDDSADNPRFIQTLPRRGYRFIYPLNGEFAVGPIPRPVRPRAAMIITACVSLLAIVVATSFYVLELRTRPSAPHITSLAVLPFTNLSGDPNQEYFADAITEALITDLAKIRALKVISRTSIMRYKNTKTPLPQIARELGVDGIVEGSVQRAGPRIAIKAQLIQASTDTHIWAETYERDMSDVLHLESEVAQSIAREIRVAVTPEEQERLATARRVDPEAYEAYLRGNLHRSKLSQEELNTAEQYYGFALQKDPNYAPAHVGLAMVWYSRGDAGFIPINEALPRGKAVLQKALELDETLAEAHATLGNFKFAYEWDWVGAEREFQRAIQLNNSSGHFGYADFLISMRRFEEWKSEARRALELDPVSFLNQTFINGWHLVYLGRYDEAIAQMQKVLAAQPDYSSAHLGLWGAYYKKRMYGEALGEAKKFFAVLHEDEVVKAMDRGNAEGGYRPAMKRAAEAMAARSAHTHTPAVRVARLYAHAADKDRAMQWLEKAYQQRETALTHAAVFWDWDDLRVDPRFQALLRRMNLPQ